MVANQSCGDYLIGKEAHYYIRARWKDPNGSSLCLPEEQLADNVSDPLLGWQTYHRV